MAATEAAHPMVPVEAVAHGVVIHHVDVLWTPYGGGMSQPMFRRSDPGAGGVLDGEWTIARSEVRRDGSFSKSSGTSMDGLIAALLARWGNMWSMIDIRLAEADDRLDHCWAPTETRTFDPMDGMWIRGDPCYALAQAPSHQILARLAALEAEELRKATQPSNAVKAAEPGRLRI